MQKYFETNLIDCGDRIGDEVVVAVSTIPSTGFEIVVRIGFFELPQFTDKIMLTSTPVAIAFTCEGKCKYYATTQKALYQLVLPRDGETYGAFVEKHKDDVSLYDEFMRISAGYMVEVLKEDIEIVKKMMEGKK